MDGLLRVDPEELAHDHGGLHCELVLRVMLMLDFAVGCCFSCPELQQKYRPDVPCDVSARTDGQPRSFKRH